MFRYGKFLVSDLEKITEQVLDLCDKAESINRRNRFREGNIIEIGENCTVVVSGDLHGHRSNFCKLVTEAGLDDSGRHLIFQEIIHGGPQDDMGGCLSFKVLLEVMKLQLKYPNQVHVILGNHDTAFINDHDVSKGGREMNKAMKSSMSRSFKSGYVQVYMAMRNYMKSLPLAVKCINGIWISHSLTADRFLDKFDDTIFSRELTMDDYVRPGSAYLLTWGRRQSAKNLEETARRLGVKLFVVGHQAQEAGSAVIDPNCIILASDHNQGCFLDFSTDESYSLDSLSSRIRKLASVAAESIEMEFIEN